MRSKLFLLLYLFTCSVQAQRMVAVGKGWAGNTINTVVFRKNSVVTHNDTQFTAYYEASGHVVLAKRKWNSNQWQVKQTNLTGNIRDAHNSISIMIDGEGYLHIAWDHHANPLHYTRSKSPGSLELLLEQPMAGKEEEKVTYPEFYRLPDGDLLFLYRDGVSGRGNLVLNRYYTKSKKMGSVGQ